MLTRKYGVQSCHRQKCASAVFKQTQQLLQQSPTALLSTKICPLLKCKRVVRAAVAQVEVAAPTATEQQPKSEVAAAAPAATEQQPKSEGYGDAILLQGFGWGSCKEGNWYTYLTSIVDDLKALGISHIWLPPPSQSVAPQGYLPSQLYNLSSKYGNKEQLVELIKKLKAAGISPIADIVVNHRCADEESDGVYNEFKDDVDHQGKRIDWGKWAITGNDPAFKGQGNPDTGEDFGPAPDLDHANPELRAAIVDWLTWLQKDIGYDGWRFDFVKGFAPEYVREYIDATTGEKALSVGEYWTDVKWSDSKLDFNQDGPRQALCDWLEGAGQRACLFDFPNKGIVQEAAKNTEYWRLRDERGKAPGLLGWAPTKAITFVDNHDTGSSQGHWPFPDNHVGAGNAYILTHPGIPCIFIEHWATWGPELRETLNKLTALRRRNGIRSDSKLEILAADADLYVARIDDKVILKLGPRHDIGDLNPRAEDGWHISVTGNDFAVWERTPVEKKPEEKKPV